MAKTPKDPNPKFFKAKDNIDWKKQWENLKVCGGIFYEMLKETDWEAFKDGWKNTLKTDAARIKEEYNAFMALDQQGKLDAVLYGEKRLGRLYAKGAMATVRRDSGRGKGRRYTDSGGAHLRGVRARGLQADKLHPQRRGKDHMRPWPCRLQRGA